MALPLNYHWGSLVVRKTTTLLTMLVIGAVVGTFSWLLGFVVQLDKSLAVSSDPRTVIVLQRGAISETNSGIDPEHYNNLVQVNDVELDPATQSRLISPELMWQTQLPRVRDNGVTRANVALRGVTDAALKVHQRVHIVAGRMFGTGAPEVVVGVGAARQFKGLQIGDRLRLGFGENRDFEVVGWFSADGGPLESEIWTYLPAMQSAYSRVGYSSAALRIKAGTDPAAIVKAIDSPAVQLGAQLEGDYWREQSKNIRIYQTICYILVVVMSLAAIFSIANTMFAAVDGRKREIAMLRTIGFTGGHIWRGFVFEAVILSLLGGAIGLGLCQLYLALVGNTKDMFGANTFTSLAFEIHLTPTIIAIALTCAAVVGALGAFVPAWRAGRTQVITALREE